MLSAIEPGSPMPIHRHKYSSETVVCLRGRLVEEFYDDLERMCIDAIELSPGGPNVAINIPAGQWHTVRALVILGKYTFPADMSVTKIGEIGDAVAPFIELGPASNGTSPTNFIHLAIPALGLIYFILGIIGAAIPKKRKEKVA